MGRPLEASYHAAQAQPCKGTKDPTATGCFTSIDKQKRVEVVDVSTHNNCLRPQGVRTFILAVSPATVAASLQLLDTTISGNLTGALSSLSGALTPLGAGATLTTSLISLSGAKAAAADVSAKLTDLNTNANALPVRGGGAA